MRRTGATTVGMSIARFWLNLNYKNELDGVTWEQRLFVAVWMALTALALGEDVLVHCRQGCHRSGIMVMLLMAILAVVGFQDLIFFFCFLLGCCRLQGVVSVQCPMRVRKGGMVELVVLLMPHCSRECLIMQDYDSIEAKYFERNSRVQWSE